MGESEGVKVSRGAFVTCESIGAYDSAMPESDAPQAATVITPPAAEPAPDMYGSTTLEKAWAIAGLIAAGVLAWMAYDLLRGPRPPEGAHEQGSA